MIRYLVITTTALLLLQGCGGGGGGTSADGSGSSSLGSLGPSQIDMQPNQSYTVYPGDKVVKTTDNAEITISHTDGHNESTVTLIAGEAQIIRK